MIDEACVTMGSPHNTGAIGKQTLRDFESQTLPPPSYTADNIRSLCERLHVIQVIFAAYLNASLSRRHGAISINELDTWLADRVKQLTANKQTPTTTKPNTVPDFPVAAVR